jgi:hypothetical protein
LFRLHEKWDGRPTFVVCPICGCRDVKGEGSPRLMGLPGRADKCG